MTISEGVPGVLLERFNNIGGGTVSSLTGHAKYPEAPDASGIVSSFESPSNQAENYGMRMRAYVTAPVSGQYRFWIAADDAGELRLGTNEYASSGVLIASPTQWSGSRHWTKYASQRSVFDKFGSGSALLY